MKTSHSKSSKSNHPNERRYLTHNNGDYAYLIYLGSNKATVYKQDGHALFIKDKRKLKDSYNTFVKSYKNVERIYIPRCAHKTKLGKIHSYSGNTILIKSMGTYTYIGDEIVNWKPEKNENIISYQSHLDNSDMPYAVAIGKAYVYLISEKIYIPKSCFPTDTDWHIEAYGIYYGMSETERNMLKN